MMGYIAVVDAFAILPFFSLKENFDHAFCTAFSCTGSIWIKLIVFRSPCDNIKRIFSLNIFFTWSFIGIYSQEGESSRYWDCWGP